MCLRNFLYGGIEEAQKKKIIKGCEGPVISRMPFPGDAMLKRMGFFLTFTLK
jgi:hypothetical protein